MKETAKPIPYMGLHATQCKKFESVGIEKEPVGD